MLRRIRQFATLVTLGAVACSAQLPSEQPLGIGPLARLRHAEPSGAPVSMPGSTPQMQFEGDDGEEDESTAKAGENPSSLKDDDAPDAGAVKADAGPAPIASAPASNLPPAAIDFTGEYSGKDVITTRVAGKEMKPAEDPNAKLSVKKTGDGVSFTIVASNTGDPLCTVKGEQKGDTATLPRDQECPPQSQILGKLTRGQARLQGKQLTLDMTFELSAEVEGVRLTATTDYHFEGTR